MGVFGCLLRVTLPWMAVHLAKRVYLECPTQNQPATCGRHPPTLPPAGLLALGDLHGVSTHEVPVAGARAEGEAEATGGPPTAGQAMPDLELAAELALTCRELYRRSPAGLAPEIVYFANVTGEHLVRCWWLHCRPAFFQSW